MNNICNNIIIIYFMLYKHIFMYNSIYINISITYFMIYIEYIIPMNNIYK